MLTPPQIESRLRSLDRMRLCWGLATWFVIGPILGAAGWFIVDWIVGSMSYRAVFGVASGFLATAVIYVLVRYLFDKRRDTLHAELQRWRTY